MEKCISCFTWYSENQIAEWLPDEYHIYSATKLCPTCQISTKTLNVMHRSKCVCAKCKRGFICYGPRDNPDTQRFCPYCGKPVTVSSQAKLTTPLTLEEIALLHKKPYEGYIICYLPRNHPQSHKTCGWQSEHRLILEAKLGRRLETNEHAHHKNENKLDNNPDNIELQTKSSHAKLHNPHTGLFRKCLICGTTFYVFRTLINQGRGFYCSKKCAALSPSRLKAQRNLRPKVANYALNEYVFQQKNKGRTWLSLSRELNVAIGTARDRYRWFLNNAPRGDGHGTRTTATL